LKLLERVAEGDVQRSGMVARRVDRGQSLALVVASIITGILCSNDHAIAVAALLHPVANPLLRLIVLVDIGSVDEITTPTKLSEVSTVCLYT
jgi:hypothetical protein